MAQILDEALDFASELIDSVHAASPVLTAAYWYDRAQERLNEEDDRLWCLAMCEAFGGVAPAWINSDGSYMQESEYAANYQQHYAPYEKGWNPSVC